MASNPQLFFRFAARHYPLLIDLFYRLEWVTLAIGTQKATQKVSREVAI